MKKKILLLTANPKGTGRLAIDKEIREIRKSIQLANKRNFELIPRLAVEAMDFRKELLIEKPFIVHFSGHGNPSGGILIEDGKGSYKVISPTSLAKLFKTFKENIKCVILNACYSEKQANAIVKHIPYVIGSNAKIEDGVATAFSSAFYDALNAGEGIPFAFNYGKDALLLSDPTKTDMLVLKISALEQKLINKKKALKELKQEFQESKRKLEKDCKINDFEIETLKKCPFPKLTQWLMEKKLTLAKKAQQAIFPNGTDLDKKIFIREFKRHLELVIANLLLDDQGELDEPNLNKSVPLVYYVEAFSFVKQRITSTTNRFSEDASSRVISDIDYLVSRL